MEREKPVSKGQLFSLRNIVIAINHNNFFCPYLAMRPPGLSLLVTEHRQSHLSVH